MRFLSVISILLVAALLSGCTFGGGIIGSGKVVTVEKDFTGFSKVAIGSAFTADITRADKFSVVVTVDDNLEKYLRVVQTGDTLKITLEMGPSFSLRGNNTLKAKITLPELSGVTASGASNVTLTGFKSAAALATDVSGASTLKGDAQAGDARFVVSGASTLNLQGAGRNLTLSVSGASTANLDKFAVADVRADVSGASSATVNATGRLDAEASGASKLRYTGSPVLGTIHTSGASSVDRK
ncbi:MAG: DUF2807 domain-containing protein [Chloroflexi bacterium]|nr:DUF2807 domain-containing protein [Chloroflexota bacterium]